MTENDMTHEEIELLLGAYALHAVEDGEAEAVRQHLTGCPRCRHELSGFEAAAAAFGNISEDAPPDLWDRIAGQLGSATAPPPLRLAPETLYRERAEPQRRNGSRRRGWGRRSLPLLVAAAAAAVAIAYLGVDVSNLDTKVGHLEAASGASIARTAEAAVGTAGAQLVELRSKSGTPSAEVVVLPGGQSFLLHPRLPRLGNGRTYQLWGQSGTKLVSLALLGAAPSATAFRLDGLVTRLMITAEPAGGVVAPTSPVLFSAALRAL